VSVLFTKIDDGLGRLGFSAIRRFEQQLSPETLYTILAPLALARAASERVQPIPSYFRKSTPPQTVRHARMNYFLSRVLEFFPDRLSTAKWQTCFQTTGLDHIREAQKRGRRIVLVCFHFGTFKLIPFWLRALGIPVIALLRGKSDERSHFKRMKDQLSPFRKIPTVLYSADQLRRVIDFLSSGCVLMLAADRETGRQITVPIDNDWSFRMATGAIRLASHCDAELIPCCMTDEGHWHFHLEIMPPVPRKYLANRSDMMPAGQHLLQEMLPRIRNHPEHCTNYLLNCFQTNVSASVPEYSIA
jgi:lauroyl/myristoyl acyltransferase